MKINNYIDNNALKMNHLRKGSLQAEGQILMNESDSNRFFP